MESRNELFPIFLKAHVLNIAIVGAGNVGLEKLFFMLKSSPNAQVRLIAREVSDEVMELIEGKTNIELRKKSFEPADLDGIQIVIAATDDRETNSAIRDIAKGRNVIVNVADTPDLCDFYLGSIVTKGDLKLAISTNGKSPTFAKRFREVLEESLPESVPEMLVNLRKIRDSLKGNFGSKVEQLNELTSVLAGKL